MRKYLLLASVGALFCGQAQAAQPVSVTDPGGANQQSVNSSGQAAVVGPPVSAALTTNHSGTLVAGVAQNIFPVSANVEGRTFRNTGANPLYFNVFGSTASGSVVNGDQLLNAGESYVVPYAMTASISFWSSAGTTVVGQSYTPTGVIPGGTAGGCTLLTQCNVAAPAWLTSTVSTVTCSLTSAGVCGPFTPNAGRSFHFSMTAGTGVGVCVPERQLDGVNWTQYTVSGTPFGSISYTGISVSEDNYEPQFNVPWRYDCGGGANGSFTSGTLAGKFTQ